MTEDRFRNRLRRQRDIIPIDKLSDRRVDIIGVGAIGRQVAYQLTAMGVQNIKLIDHDNVEDVNIGPQGYWEEDVGTEEKPIRKVDATGNLLKKINSNLNLEVLAEKFRASDKVAPIVFCCVDSMDTRKFIWENVCENIEFFVDGRMNATSMRVFSVFDAASAEHYNHPDNLFPSSDADAGACTAKATIYTSNIIAGLMVNSLVQWMRNRWTENKFNMRKWQDFNFNLVTGQFILFGE